MGLQYPPPQLGSINILLSLDEYVYMGFQHIAESTVLYEMSEDKVSRQLLTAPFHLTGYSYCRGNIVLDVFFVLFFNVAFHLISDCFLLDLCPLSYSQELHYTWCHLVFEDAEEHSVPTWQRVFEIKKYYPVRTMSDEYWALKSVSKERILPSL